MTCATSTCAERGQEPAILLALAAAVAPVPPGAAGEPFWSEITAVLRLDLLLRLSMAVVLGGLIGLEREIAGKPAGLRTNILICVGAALLADVSIRIGWLENGSRIGDPARLMAQIVSGVGFLGAGTIMQARGTVTGLTSAATIWVVAAIGIAVGAGYYIEAAGTGLLVTVVLRGLGPLEYHLRRARRVTNGTVRARPHTPAEAIEHLLDANGIRVLSRDVYDHPEDRTFELRLAGPARQFGVAQDALARDESILDVHFGH